MNTEAKKRSNSLISHQVFGVGRSARVVFKVENEGECELKLANSFDGIADQFLVHGAIQRIRDAAAISRDTRTGLPASAREKLENMKLLCEHYNSGAENWSPARAPNDGLGGEKGLLVKVLERAGARIENIPEWVKAKSGPEVKTLLNSAKLKPLADEIRAEGCAKVDADELLKDLGI